MMGSPYFAFRRCLTGVTEHAYYRGDVLIGHAAEWIVPGFPVALQGGGRLLQCDREPAEATRILTEEGTGQTAARVLPLETGIWQLEADGLCLQVLCGDGHWQFLQEGTLVAELSRRENGDVHAADWDWQLRLVLTAMQPLTDEQARLMLSFPLLQC